MEFIKGFFESNILMSLAFIALLIQNLRMYRKGVEHGIYPKRTKKDKIKSAIITFLILAGIGLVFWYLYIL